MNVTLHERNLSEIRERYRVIHEQQLAQLSKLAHQSYDRNIKLAEVPPSGQTNSVDVLA